MKHAMKQLVRFGYHQAMSCLFPVCIFLSLALTKVIEVPFIHRYDFILICCLLMQLFMFLSGLETKDELKVITVFHLIGLGLELFKVHMGSWAYPEEAWSKVGGVPLYSGFMYASVASYICQSWRRLDLKWQHWPGSWLTVMLGTAIYVNFFTHHIFYDLRWWITAALCLLFYRTYVHYRVGQHRYRMHAIVSYLLIAFFIWLAENISTFLGAWKYPDQELSWRMVHWGKYSSWFLLVSISVMIVAQLKRVKQARGEQSFDHKSKVLM
ncbi:DUF817 domain-containing protein [Marinicrinis sediminis]|uniref:DUF817 domain-containing protein n=1 Tax=Marinicrinis sediminis TaxID=1652465 RepID=A0ABW5RF65_9BACL